jgi:hypothetical protein
MRYVFLAYVLMTIVVTGCADPARPHLEELVGRWGQVTRSKENSRDCCYPNNIMHRVRDDVPIYRQNHNANKVIRAVL